MDRCCVVVDAGYLIAEGAEAYVSAGAKRGDVTIDYANLVARLAGQAARDSGLPLLRVYWHDGAVDAVPTSDQHTVAALPNVKLRLGRVSNGRQKGVDGLVYRDLSVLSRERAVSEFFVVAGDEDLREGVVAAQEVGARVTLWQVGSENQARTLVAEVDRAERLDDMAPYFTLATGSRLAHLSPAGPGLDAARQTGRRLAEEWLSRATDDDLKDLLAARPSIPKTLDAELLRQGRAALGELRDADDARRALRAGFWDVITSASTSGASEPGR